MISQPQLSVNNARTRVLTVPLRFAIMLKSPKRLSGRNFKGEGTVNIIPKPLKIENAEGSFRFDSAVRVFAPVPIISSMFDEPDETVAPDGRTVVFELGVTEYDYVLEIFDTGVKAVAGDAEGLFHAAITLKQLVECSDNGEIAACRICDRPRFPYRGVLMDVSRHFFGVDVVKKVIDAMALFKFNYLHLHLSDDQGFRIACEKMPLLTEHASRRAQTCGDGKPYGGFFTEADVREIVSYAAERYVNVMPEIDLPGHTRAVVSAYPELSCSGKPVEVATKFGIFSEILCAGKDETYEAVRNILGDVAKLFPCKYFHIGGDEVAKLEWAKCERCRALMEKEGLADYEKLQGYFTCKVTDMLEELGKTPVVWNEALLSGMLDKNAVIQYWKPGAKSAREVAAAVREEGRRVIVSRHNPYYLDQPYGYSSLKAAYEFEPCLAEFGEGAEAFVTGVECTLWAEHIDSAEKLFSMMFPRAAAVAESGWSAPQKNYSVFAERLRKVIKMLRAMGINYTSIGDSNPSFVKGIVETVAFQLKNMSRIDASSARNWRSIGMRPKKKK